MSSDLKSIKHQYNLKEVKSYNSSIYEFEDFCLDAAHLMLSRCSGEEISLAPKVVETLLALVERGGEIVSKDELMDRLWANAFVEESNLVQNIYILRKALGETAEGKPMIETLRRRGYRFNGELKENKQAQPALAAARINDATEDVSDTPPGISDKAIAEKMSAVVPSGHNGPLTAFALIGLLVGAIALGYYPFSAGKTTVGAKKTIAVLPLKPISTMNRDEIYEAGIADSLINQLSSMKGFVVRPLSATRQYADIAQDPIAAGREQQVDYVLASNYQLAGGKIKVTSQLFNVANGQIEETYKSEKDAGDVFAMQDAVADEIGRLLLERFATVSTGPAAKRGTTNEEAYRFYLQGMFLLDRTTARQKAVEAFEQSIRLDPSYAQGWAGLAVAYGFIAFTANTNIGEQYQKSIEAINKALSLDSNVSEAYTALCATKYQYEWDFAGAERACQRALELNHNSSLAHNNYARFLIAYQRHDEAIAEIKTAIDLDPTSFFNQRMYANILYFSRRYDKAVAQYKRLMQLNEEIDPTYQWLIRTLEMQGKEAEAFEWLMKSPSMQKKDDNTIQLFKTAYQTSGWAGVLRNTPGLIMNVVTPSGTNKISGSVSYRIRRPSFYSRPFFYPASASLPDNKADNFTAAVGGPIIKDRWHFYFGYENGKRDDKAVAVRLLTISEADKAQLIAAGLPDSIFPAAIPSLETGPFYIFRTDTQLNDNNRLTARFNHSDLLSKNLIQGRFNTLERSVNTNSVDYALAVQLASFAPRFLNEFRFQYAQRKTSNKRNEFSGSGPSVVISNVASFGSPDNADTVTPLEKVTQIQDNLTLTRGSHAVKFGGGFNFIDDLKCSAISARYTFPSITAYLDAKNGINPRSYNRYEETFGDPEITYKSTFWNFFVQDDWKLTRRLKINYGLRYDLYRIPKADSSSPFPSSQKFNVHKNNFAPRLGIVYALREGNRPTILRAGAGIYYETPWLNMYERALQDNGNPRYFSFSFSGNINGMTTPNPNAPAFPNTFSGSLPAGSNLPPQDIDTIAPDFETMYALHANVQLEQAITENLSFAVGYIHSGGRHIAVYRNINLIPFRFLADGRPVFSSSVNSFTRFDPRFNNIFIAESAGVSEYNALTLQLTKRLSRGLQFSANYTLSKATDDAPEQNLSTGALFQNLMLTDPYNRRLDKGNSFADQRHTFVMSLVAHPKFIFENKTLRYLFNQNQVGIIATANSGETFNIVSTSDINGDGTTISDRPIGIKRNSGTTPPQFNVDLRYSRFLNFTERYRLEVFGEFQNLFNINSIVQFNNVTVATNANGELIGELPDFKARNQSASQDSRQFQLGLKFIF